MNAEQKRMLQAVFVILGCLGIYTYTLTLPVYRYCDWTGLKIEERYGHEVSFEFVNGTTTYYACINISLQAFEHVIETEEIDHLSNVQVRCVQCGMLMDWDDPMNVWIYQPEYLCPTTGNPTMIVVCEGLCEDHFSDRYDGDVVPNPFEWPD
jgi:hypothetical protein